MIVCVCNQVSDREITRCVRAGMSFNDIQLELGVATCCGSCEPCARELVARVQREAAPAFSSAVRPAMGGAQAAGGMAFA